MFLGKYESTEAVLETIKAIEHPISSVIDVLVTICSYAGTGNVLQIQKLLHNCTAKVETEDEDEDDESETVRDPSASTQSGEPDVEKSLFDSQVQAFSVLGVATIAMGEDIGQEMVFRHFGHLMHYGEAHIRRAVPLAMGLVSASNPEMKVFDTLSRYSHDSDLDVAATAIFQWVLSVLAQIMLVLLSFFANWQVTMFAILIPCLLSELPKVCYTWERAL